MIIQTASDVFRPQIQRSITDALSKGAAVTIPAVTEEETASITTALTGFNERIKANPAGLPMVKLDLSTQQVLAKATTGWSTEQRTMIGIGSGVAMGVGVGLLLDQLRVIAPKSSLVLSIACGLAGGGMGAAVAGKIAEIEFTRDEKGTLGVKMSGVKD